MNEPTPETHPSLEPPTYRPYKISNEFSHRNDNFNTVSLPKRDMIMPSEFNSVSDPSYSQSATQADLEPPVCRP